MVVASRRISQSAWSRGRCMQLQYNIQQKETKQKRLCCLPFDFHPPHPINSFSICLIWYNFIVSVTFFLLFSLLCVTAGLNCSWNTVKTIISTKTNKATNLSTYSCRGSGGWCRWCWIQYWWMIDCGHRSHLENDDDGEKDTNSYVRRMDQTNALVDENRQVVFNSFTLNKMHKPQGQ